MIDYTTTEGQSQAPFSKIDWRLAICDVLEDSNFDWRNKKYKTLRLDDLYERAGNVPLSIRARSCSTALEFLENSETEKKRVRSGNFCNLRLCPLCTARKSYKAARRLSTALRICEEEHPGCQFLFLTLTMKNVGFGELGSALSLLTNAWGKLRRHRKVARAVKGWFRALEITYSKDEGFHPHIHAIIVVENQYFQTSSGLYLTHDDWMKQWRLALQVSYDPRVDIRATHTTKGRRAKKLVDGAIEAAKYAVKDSEYISDKLTLDDGAAIVKEYTSAMHNRRLTAYGGWLKEVDGDLDVDLDDTIYDLLVKYRWSFGAGDYIIESYDIVDSDD